MTSPRGGPPADAQVGRSGCRGHAGRRAGPVAGPIVDQGVATGRSLPDLAGREFQGLARRGRDLVGAIRTSNAIHQAVHRTRTARSRVKAATTRRPKPAATRSASTRPRPAKPKAAARADGKR